MTRPRHRRRTHALLAMVLSASLAGCVTKYTYLGREAPVQVETEAGPLIVQLADPGMGGGLGSGRKVSVVIRRDALMGFDAAGKRVATET